MASSQPLVDFLDDGFPNVRISSYVESVAFVDESIPKGHPRLMWNLLRECAESFNPVLIIDDGDSKDVHPGNAIGDLVLSTRLVCCCVLELGQVGKPSCLFWSDANLLLNLCQSGVISDPNKWDVGQ